MNNKFCVRLGKSARKLTKSRRVCTAVIHYRECKLLRVIDVSENARKVSNMTNALEVHSPESIEKGFDVVGEDRLQTPMQIAESVVISEVT
ncbi:hypothetical protein TNCV_3747441 [Trichonephila clavipes]|nr:hypothetical protein TNCV_3747441 [Trichonephila clavipes]